MTTIDADQAAPTAGPPVWRRRSVAAVGALAATVTVHAAARAVGLETSSPAVGGDPAAVLTLSKVMIAASTVTLAALGLVALLDRVGSRPRTIWLIAAAVVFAVSMGAPLSGPDIGAADRAGLTLLHLAVASPLLVGLTPTLPRSRARRHEPTE